MGMKFKCRIFNHLSNVKAICGGFTAVSPLPIVSWDLFSELKKIWPNSEWDHENATWVLEPEILKSKSHFANVVAEL